MIDILHHNDIGVIMDFVPVHFALDAYALAKFDGTALYEYPHKDVGNSEWEAVILCTPVARCAPFTVLCELLAEGIPCRWSAHGCHQQYDLLAGQSGARCE